MTDINIFLYTSSHWFVLKVLLNYHIIIYICALARIRSGVGNKQIVPPWSAVITTLIVICN